MAGLNLLVDEHDFTIEQAADSLITTILRAGESVQHTRLGKPLVIGSKAFTENYILATFFAKYIEATTPYATELRLGFGGTKLLFDAFTTGSVALYPEYTGTALLVFLQPDAAVIDSLLQSPEKIYTFTNKGLSQSFGAVMLPSLGFNNTTALMMREDLANELGIASISDLKNYINRF